MITNEKQKPGAQQGNTNAQRADDPASSTVVFRCTLAQKATLVHAAQAAGKKLTAFVLGAAMAEAEKQRVER